MKKRITFNSPVILGFTIICFAAFLLNMITLGKSNTMFFSVYRTSFLHPLTYVRLVGHVFGHASLEHLLGNITLLLVTGPLLEEKYGARQMVYIIGITAVVTGLVHVLLFPNTQLLGASGVVFALILLSSFASVRQGGIPLTFILVAVLYMGTEIYEGIFMTDNISNLTHIVGGMVGAFLGYRLNQNKMN